MQKTLVAYGTRIGATANTAAVIADVLQNKFDLVVDVINLGKVRRIDLTQYQNIIIGSSIVANRWTNRAKNFLKKDFSNKRVIVFVSAAGTLNRAAENGLSIEEAVTEAITKYIDNVIPSNIEPIAKMAFGGRMIFFGKEKYNNWNRDTIASWAEEVGRYLTA
ncbi:MAG: flavodoxin domain-containing protein [Candidatus Hermodarchaeota archaeon]